MLNLTTYTFLGEGGGGGKRGGREKEQEEEEKEKRREYKMKLGWVLGCQIYIFPSKGDNDQKNIPFGVFIFVINHFVMVGIYLQAVFENH